MFPGCTQLTRLCNDGYSVLVIPHTVVDLLAWSLMEHCWMLLNSVYIGTSWGSSLDWRYNPGIWIAPGEKEEARAVHPQLFGLCLDS